MAPFLTRRRSLWAGLAAVAALARVLGSSRSAASPAPGEAVAGGRRLPAASGASVPRAGDPNRAGREERLAFEADGWSFVQEAPPDPALLALDPALLQGREAELRVQLQSTALADAQLENAYRIALRANGLGLQEAQFAAIEAIGRSDSPAAQEWLQTLFERIPENGARGQILGLLRPRALDDESARFLMRVLEDERLDGRLRAQAAAPYILRALLEGNEEMPQEPLDRLDPEWQGRIRRMFRTAARTGKPAAHRHGGP